MGILSRYKKILLEKESYYKTIGAIHCPYFDKKIVFNSDGFHHLRYKTSGSEREKQTQLYKFNLLSHACEKIKCSGTLQQYRKQWSVYGRRKNANGSSEMKEMEYYAFEGILGKDQNMTRTKVVIRRVGNGELHFWSVMSDVDLKRKSTYKFASDDVLDH
jgi:hypothetical protein